MAIDNFYKLSATPYALKYFVEADEDGGVQLVPKADMLNDCVNGPLKSFLLTLTNTTWQQLYRAPGAPNKDIDVSSVARSIGGEFHGPAPSVAFALEGPDQVMHLVFPGDLAGGAAGVVTLRYNHSMAR